MNKEQEILKRWIAIKESNGLSKARKANTILFITGLVLCPSITFIYYFKLNTALLIALSIVLGWSIAEGNTLRSRIEVWPLIEKYLNWEMIKNNNKNG